MGYMDRLPTVISCCFCCFLRAGTVMIALVSFLAGLFLAPNVSHTPGIWDLNGVLTSGNSSTELAIQQILGIISIFLCVASILLLVGALCNFPKLIELYQWAAIGYSFTIVLMFASLAIYCVIVHENCVTAGITLFILMIANILITAYFVIVTNSLRTSMVYLNVVNSA